MKRLTKELLQERSNVIHNNTYEVIGDYINNSTKILFKHLTCGNIFEQQPNNHLQGKGCSNCNKYEKWTISIMQQKSDYKYNFSYLICNFVSKNDYSIVKHKICNTIFNILPQNHFNDKGGCPNCFINYNSVKWNKELLQQRSDQIHNSEYEIVGEYINCDTKIKIKHIICKNIFEQTPYKHLYQNSCPNCFGKNKLTKEILQEKSNKKYNNEYTIIGDYINNSTPILVKHNVCQSEYYQSPANHLKERTCFKCRGNQSNGEKLIQSYLDNLNIKYFYNNSLPGCKYKNKSLRFDFYLPDYKTCIEYDGEQHFKPIKRFGGEERYKISLERDNIKNEWCKENSISLIRISYKESILDKLNNAFNI